MPTAGISDQLPGIGRAFIEFEPGPLVRPLAKICQRISCGDISMRGRFRLRSYRSGPLRFGFATLNVRAFRLQSFEHGNVPTQFGIRELNPVVIEAFPDALQLVSFSEGGFDLRPKASDLSRLELRYLVNQL